MKKIFSITAILNRALILFATFFMLSPATAQKNKKYEKTTQLHITQEQINKVNELLKPVKEKIQGLLSKDESGTYQQYQADIKTLQSNIKSEERNALLIQVKKKYAAFINRIWLAANVDEESYQQQIVSYLPVAMRKGITWYPFLSCVIVVSVPASIPAVEPLPQNKCIDVCSNAQGSIIGHTDLLAGGDGSYGNCYFKTNAWGAVGGYAESIGTLKNGVTIPGTFPNDNRKIRVKKSFDLEQVAGSFSALGCAVGETDVSTYANGYEYLACINWLIWVTTKNVKKTVTEEYVLEKKDIAMSAFKGMSTSLVVFGGSWGSSNCTNIKWTMCEE